jgi:UDP-2-acetamido-2-deoxy-ribo-hexuluronate aminotransferase
LKSKRQGELTPKLIIPVDLFGLPADYEAIDQVAKKYNLLVLEDAAQGFGGNINGKKACSFGDAATTSFFPAKPLGCYGDGGAIFTQYKELANMSSGLFEYMEKATTNMIMFDRNEFKIGYTSSSYLIEKLAILENELDVINYIASDYNTLIIDKVSKPIIPEQFYSSYAQYTLICNSSDERKHLIQSFNENDIPTSVFYPKPLSHQTAYINDKFNKRNNKISLYLSERAVSIPIHPYLSKSERQKIVSVINAFYK